MKMSKKHEAELRKYTRKMEQQFKGRNTYGIVESDARDLTVTTRTWFNLEPMSGCEEMAFDVEIGREWAFRTSVLAAMQEGYEGLDDPIVAFADQFRKIADGILKHYEAEIDRQLALDLKWAKENPGCAKEFRKRAAAAKKRVARSLKGGR